MFDSSAGRRGLYFLSGAATFLVIKLAGTATLRWLDVAANIGDAVVTVVAVLAMMTVFGQMPEKRRFFSRPPQE